jgi:hypothetical protein
MHFMDSQAWEWRWVFKHFQIDPQEPTNQMTLQLTVSVSNRNRRREEISY